MSISVAYVFPAIIIRVNLVLIQKFKAPDSITSKSSELILHKTFEKEIILDVKGITYI